MKFLCPALLVLFLAACAPPEPGTAAHQQLLAAQAREHFYALKALERKSSHRLTSGASLTIAQPVFVPTQAASVPAQRAFIPTQPKPVAKRDTKARPDVTRTAKSRRNDDTIYYYDMPRGPEPTSERYRAYKLQYARELGKRPEALTTEEREWARRHYRD